MAKGFSNAGKESCKHSVAVEMLPRSLHGAARIRFANVKKRAAPVPSYLRASGMTVRKSLKIFSTKNDLELELSAGT